MQKWCVRITNVQATLTKKKLEATTAFRRGVTVDPFASLCNIKNSTFLFIMSQVFICGLKSKDISFFFPSFFYFRLQFWEISFLFQQYLFFSTLLFYDRQFWRQNRTNSAWGKKKFNFFGRKSLIFSLTWITSYGL